MHDLIIPLTVLDRHFRSRYNLINSRISLATDEEERMVNTLADAYEHFLADNAALNQLRPNTLRAYRYELGAAATDGVFQLPLTDLTLADLEHWISRAPASPSTVGRRAAALS